MDPTAGRSVAPLVSVVLAVYNRRDLVGQAIESVLAQDWPALELVVVDDGSIDGTGEAVEAFAPRVTLIRQRNQGPAAARNTGFAAARGEFLALLDSDDLMLPGSLRARAQVLLDHPEAGFAYGRTQHEKSDGTLDRAPLPPATDAHAWPRGDLLGRYARKPFFRHFDMLFRRSLLPADGLLYDPALRNLEDYAMVLRLLARAEGAPCPAWTVRLRAEAGGRRQRFAYAQTLRQGIAPAERLLADPTVQARLAPHAHVIRARFLEKLSAAARGLGDGPLYRRYVRLARAENPQVVGGFKFYRRYLASYLLRSSHKDPAA